MPIAIGSTFSAQQISHCTSGLGLVPFHFQVPNSMLNRILPTIRDRSPASNWPEHQGHLFHILENLKVRLTLGPIDLVALRYHQGRILGCHGIGVLLRLVSFMVIIWMLATSRKKCTYCSYPPRESETRFLFQKLK